MTLNEKKTCYGSTQKKGRLGTLWLVPSTEQGELEPNGWCQAHKKTWYLMDGAEHRKETWNLMVGAEHRKGETWYLMDGAEHTGRLGT